MFKNNIYYILAGILLLSSCAKEEKPVIVPAISVKSPVVVQQQKKHPLGTIGEVEPIYFLPMKTPFSARIDTGAETSSIDVEDQNFFERDGESWVAFDIVNRSSGEKHHFEKKIIKQKKVKRIENSEDRIIVPMDVKFGGKILKPNFSLANRDKFNYQALIGRNILTGLAVVDTSLANTLK
ncbi:MAG: ATP-dependent zinc protease [Alphaproteobacteria bacterium]|nr:ATP-dependent zinc protease [Alphaproteobacteria bacterium]